MTKDRPYEVKFELSKYYTFKDAQTFKPGTYQINLKFFDGDVGLSNPLDAPPRRIEVRN
ncbi:MAG: hypothetical protein QM811_29955 [Pirellulales bacterium]